MPRPKKIAKKTEGNPPRIKAVLAGERIMSNSSIAFQMHESSRLGEKVEGKIQYSFAEGLYLLNRGKLELTRSRKKLNSENLMQLASEREPNFFAKYRVFSDLRERGYTVKTALKFGADFRVYERGVKPGEDHAKWIVFPVSESSAMTWHDFSAKNRVAHSTKKNLLIAIVDDEGDVTYYEVKWLRP